MIRGQDLSSQGRPTVTSLLRSTCAVAIIAAVAAACHRHTGALPYPIVQQWPHDTAAYTQGLVYADGVLYESTGRYGHSEVRRVDPQTGRVLATTALPADRFGEGL